MCVCLWWKSYIFFSHFSIIKIPWFLLSFSFHWALQFECLAHQSILLWLHFTWFHDICIIWSFCLVRNYTLTQNWPYIEIVGIKPTNPVKYPTIIACQRNVSISAMWYVHISNCDYVLSWQFVCEMFACLQTHIKNRLFVRQYQVQCIIYWFFFLLLCHVHLNRCFMEFPIWFSVSYLPICLFTSTVCCLFLLVSYIYNFFFSLHRRRQCCCFCYFPAHFDGLMVCPFDG